MFPGHNLHFPSRKKCLRQISLLCLTTHLDIKGNSFDCRICCIYQCKDDMWRFSNKNPLCMLSVFRTLRIQKHLCACLVNPQSPKRSLFHIGGMYPSHCSHRKSRGTSRTLQTHLGRNLQRIFCIWRSPHRRVRTRIATSLP
jgi:hypothetical protein